MDAYANSQDYLLDELKRIDLVLFYHVQKSRQQRRGQGSDEFRGLYISEEEMDELFSQTSGKALEQPGEPASADLRDITTAILQKAKDIEGRKKEAKKAGIIFPMDHLVQVFGLNDFEREALLLALAPELHLKYERIYAYLQDNVTKKRPTVDLLLTLLCFSFEEKMSQRSRFCHSAPLLASQLLQLFDEPGLTHSPLLAKWVKVDDGIVDFLLGEDAVDARLAAVASWVYPKTTVKSLPLEQSLQAKLSILGTSLQDRLKSGSDALFVYFSGPYGAGKRLAAEALAHEAGLDMLAVDLRQLVASELDPADTMTVFLRQARLRDAITFWADADALLARTERAQEWKNAVFSKMRSSRGVFIFSDGAATPSQFMAEGVPFIGVSFPRPPYKLRKELWEKHLRQEGTELKPAELASLAGRFRLTDGQIRDIVATAKANWLENREGAGIPAEGLLDACRAHSRHRLVNLALKVSSRRSWGDIVLPQDQMDILREICHYVKHQPVVLDDWGFGKKLVLNKGLSVLFAGPSGTGKTMAAEILAGELGLDLYRIDLATVVSKYIGETEKNLDRIFREAEHSNAILFFDEADAIFGKRSEVRDSHDRYANIEISYLLQKMEAYDGIAILATNLRKNLDEAFLRRLNFTVDFPMPEEEDRLKIWQLCFPDDAPMGDDVDLKSLAREFKIPGGNIKNIAVTSAFHAAENGGRISMANLMHATKREFQKMGKLIVESDFERLQQLIGPPDEAP